MVQIWYIVLGLEQNIEKQINHDVNHSKQTKKGPRTWIANFSLSKCMITETF